MRQAPAHADGRRRNRGMLHLQYPWMCEFGVEFGERNLKYRRALMMLRQNSDE